MSFEDVLISIELLGVPESNKLISEVAGRVDVLSSIVGEVSVATSLLVLNYEGLDRLEDIVNRPEQDSGFTPGTTGREFIELIGSELFTRSLGVWGQLQWVLWEAQKKRSGVRLRIRTPYPLLAAQPWELMYSQDQGGFLALLPRISIVREPIHIGRARSLGATRPLRVLLCAAAPKGLPPIAVHREVDLVRTQLSGFGGAFEIEVVSGTYRAIADALERGPWHIFHFCGHGDYKPGIGGVLVFELPDGSPDIYGASTVASLLSVQTSMRLVILNSCRGAMGLGRQGLEAVAASIVQQGVPCAITMQFEVTDTAALPFAEEFYRILVQSGDVELALQAARSAISRAPLYHLEGMATPAMQAWRCMEWCTPVLHLDTADARLFSESVDLEGNISNQLESMRFPLTAVLNRGQVGPTADAPAPGSAVLTQVDRLHWRLSWTTELPPNEALARLPLAFQSLFNTKKLDLTPNGLVAYTSGVLGAHPLFAAERIEATATRVDTGTAMSVESRPNQKGQLLDQGRNKDNLARLAAFLGLKV